ncbi:MAG TPA: DUF4145 domain-containing protein [Candidatus Peribacteria bacterium]|nr:DUF4145 domain-containing protein [Candidatus Peribacteria bacterium]
MKAEYVNGNIRANCPECNGAMTTFERKDHAREYGTIVQDKSQSVKGRTYARAIYMLLRCAGCGRGGLAKICDNGRVLDGVIGEFLPYSIESLDIPGSVPSGIMKEFREAELSASVGAWRGASALLRSTLEKALKASSYTTGTLNDKINAAAADGVITEARKQKAHENIRVLGNDVVHDEWREVAEDEVQDSLHYVQRILEDLYDDRAQVLKTLAAKGKPIAS